MCSMLTSDAYAQKPPEYFGRARTDIAPLLPGCAARVLELGCGNGATMAWLRTVREVEYSAGIEFVPHVAQIAKAAFDDIIIGSLDDVALPERAASFDVILALDVLEHVAFPEDIVQKYGRLLVPSGCFIVSLPNVAHHSISFPLFARGSWQYAESGILDRTHLTFFSQNEACAIFNRNGMHIDKQTCTTDFSWFERLPILRKHSALRWYCNRVLNTVMPYHLRAFQFLIRAKVSSEPDASRGI